MTPTEQKIEKFHAIVGADISYRFEKQILLQFKKNEGYCLTNGQGTQWLNNISRDFAVLCKRAGLENCTLHVLRHTFASNLMMSGVDLGTVQKLMGHKDIKTTMRYAHLAPDHLRAGVEKLNYGHHMDTEA